jgi:hypothetical protein
MADNPDEEAYELEVPATDEIPAEWQGGAVYTLELPVRCPYCRDPIRTLRVLKITRTQVNFTSTLPRNGRAFVCPQCEKLLSVELSGIL